MERRWLQWLAIVAAGTLLSATWQAAAPLEHWRPGGRVLMDAHNCYPYFEWWGDRIDRALSAGTPLAIEQDLLWARNPRTGRMASVVSHGAPATGAEPSMREYFFERVRPIVERALREGNRGDWPLITLNLDLKSEEPEHLAAIWQLLTEYKEWLTSAPRTEVAANIEPLELRPILVLAGESEAQRKAFYDEVPAGGRLLVFGAAPTNTQNLEAAPELIEPNAADNYHRWWNNSWRVVEAVGQASAGAWTPEKEARLNSLVRHAHAKNLWIRFYTLDGASKTELSCNGWFNGYNFGSRDAVRARWQAAAVAGVDYIASDQYEELGMFLQDRRNPER